MNTPLEYRGKHASCKVFTHDVDEHAVAQIYRLLNNAAFEGSPVRIMPDVHVGKGCVVGFTAHLCKEPLRVVPAVIGVDIGCGITSVRLDGVDPDKLVGQLPAFDRHLRGNVPAGFSSRTKPSKRRQWLYQWWFERGSDWDGFEADVENLAQRTGADVSKVWCQCGSLGGGNHFLEIGRGQDDSLWLTAHSGSRNFGLKVAEFHQRKAVQQHGRQQGLEYLEGDPAYAYLRDMRIAQKFAVLNRLVMLDALTDFFHVKIRDAEIMTSVHNFIGDDDIIRKGAVSARDGETVIIPWNMKDGIAIGKGRGNADWNFSAPHGAGRKMSRGDAKQTIAVAEYRRVMQEAAVWSSCVGQDTVDESPQAYKDFAAVLAHIEDTVQVVDKLRPVYNFKAGGERD